MRAVKDSATAESTVLRGGAVLAPCSTVLDRVHVHVPGTNTSQTYRVGMSGERGWFTALQGETVHEQTPPPHSATLAGSASRSPRATPPAVAAKPPLSAGARDGAWSFAFSLDLGALGVATGQHPSDAALHVDMSCLGSGTAAPNTTAVLPGPTTNPSPPSLLPHLYLLTEILRSSAPPPPCAPSPPRTPLLQPQAGSCITPEHPTNLRVAALRAGVAGVARISSPVSPTTVMSSPEEGDLDQSAPRHPRAMPRWPGAKSPLSVKKRTEVQGKRGTTHSPTPPYAVALDLVARIALPRAAAAPRAVAAPYDTATHALHLKLAGQLPLRFSSAVPQHALRLKLAGRPPLRVSSRGGWACGLASGEATVLWGAPRDCAPIHAPTPSQRPPPSPDTEP